MFHSCAETAGLRTVRSPAVRVNDQRILRRVARKWTTSLCSADTRCSGRTIAEAINLVLVAAWELRLVGMNFEMDMAISKGERLAHRMPAMLSGGQAGSDVPRSVLAVHHRRVRRLIIGGKRHRARRQASEACGMTLTGWCPGEGRVAVSVVASGGRKVTLKIA